MASHYETEARQAQLTLARRVDQDHDRLAKLEDFCVRLDEMIVGARAAIDELRVETGLSDVRRDS
jgi:hypothetical protein